MGTPWVSFDGKDCSGCKHLNERGYCDFTGCVIPCTVRATIPDVKPQTNADRVRNMTDEELTRYLCGMACPEGLSPNSPRCPIPLDYSDEEACYKCWLDCLRKEALP